MLAGLSGSPSAGAHPPIVRFREEVVAKPGSFRFTGDRPKNQTSGNPTPCRPLTVPRLLRVLGSDEAIYPRHLAARGSSESPRKAFRLSSERVCASFLSFLSARFRKGFACSSS